VSVQPRTPAPTSGGSSSSSWGGSVSNGGSSGSTAPSPAPRRRAQLAGRAPEDDPFPRGWAALRATGVLERTHGGSIPVAAPSDESGEAIAEIVVPPDAAQIGRARRWLASTRAAVRRPPPRGGGRRRRPPARTSSAHRHRDQRPGPGHGHAIASRWGVHLDPPGKVVWFELDRGTTG
jgi:hypothetical protein